MVTSAGQVFFDLFSALGFVIDEGPALMQIIPVNLATIRLRNLRRLALIAQGSRLPHPTPGVLVRPWFVIQSPHQFGQLATPQPRQLFQRLFRKGTGRHRRHRRNAVMHQGNGVEDPLDNP
ncbi:hypothetical protein D3C86_1148060 [compost metagenome]